MKSSNINQNFEVRYYETFSGYNIPFNLQSQISEKEADKKITYYIGTYQNNMIINAKKIHHNRIIFEDKYFYIKKWYGNKLIKRISVDEHSNEIIKEY